VLSAAAIGSDDSLLTLRTHRVEKRLNHLGWVSQAQVRRSFPNSVKIELEERRAAALAHTEQGDFYLDASLALIGPVTHGLPPDLPWITGLSRAELFRPDQEARRLLAAAADLLNTNRQPAPGRVSEVNLDRVWGLSLVMDEIPATLRLGLEDPMSAWGAALTVFTDLKRRGELMRATMIDFSGRKRIVVRLGREKA
jgi:hypothetical protein